MSVKDRAREVDVMKGAMVLAMVFAHVIQIIGSRDYRPVAMAETLTDLAAFPVFVMCFGFAVQRAWLDSPTLPFASILRSAAKCYLAYVLSGIAYRILINGQAGFFTTLFNVATLRDFPGYSEFLFSFFLFTVLSPLYRDFIGLATRDSRTLVLASLPCLMIGLMPAPDIHAPLLGELVGGVGYQFFPVLSYLPIFLCGAFLARHKQHSGIGRNLLALLLLLPYVAAWKQGLPINRFPPDIVWLLASLGMALLWFGVVQAVWKKLPGRIGNYLADIGQHVLFYLLASNLIIFALHTGHGMINLPLWEETLLYILIMISIRLAILIVDEIRFDIAQHLSVSGRKREHAWPDAMYTEFPFFANAQGHAAAHERPRTRRNMRGIQRK